MTAYSAMQKSGDMAADFLQEANFWYLTGIEKPDWRLIIDGGRQKSFLVAPKRESMHEIFDGGLTHDEARAISGVHDVLTHDEGERMLQQLAKTHVLVYTVGDPAQADYFDFVLNPAPKKLTEQLRRTFRDVRDCQKELASLRAIKQPEEIASIQKAIDITCQAFSDVKEKFVDYSYEYQVEAEFDYRFRSSNTRHAYEPIVAGGRNACTLHYSENVAKIHKNQFVVMDIGARVGGYAADITRTYMQTKPKKQSRAIHDAVRQAQEQIIALIEPGLPIHEYLTKVDTIMKKALMEVGLITSLDDDEGYRTYMPHAISHGIGIDVHDSLARARYFEIGMILTVEPGIYVPEIGVGVRIEDDILVTADGHKNLSQNLPTTW